MKDTFGFPVQTAAEGRLSPDRPLKHFRAGIVNGKFAEGDGQCHGTEIRGH